MKIQDRYFGWSIGSIVDKPWDVFIISIADLEIFAYNKFTVDGKLSGSKKMLSCFDLGWPHYIFPGCFVDVHVAKDINFIIYAYLFKLKSLMYLNLNMINSYFYQKNPPS